MDLKYTAGDIKELPVGAVVYFIAEFDKIGKNLKALDECSGNALTNLLKTTEFTGKNGEIAVLRNVDCFKAMKVILLGVGEKKSLNHDSFRKAMGKLSRHKALTSIGRAVFYFDDFENATFFQGAIEGYLLGSYKLLDYKSGDDKKSKNFLKEITFAVDNKKLLNRLEKAVTQGQIIAEGQLLARTLGLKPSNDFTPIDFANKAKELARTYKFKCRILDETAIKKEKMGALLAVSKGSEEPPRFIICEYNGGPANRAPIVLVGKGVTFDSGGISLKSGLNMGDMKGDMCGGGVVLSAITTAARLKIPQNIVVLIPTVENMPSGHATKPGDIHVSRKGLTIENINTDAEGRLILADALDYANKFKPQAVIDVATLTGATLYILGYAGIPIMGNNDEIKDQFRAAADNTAEKVWELPIWDEHREQMKSSIADLQNSGGRPAGTITAGAFLENFIGDWPWLHVDIAYVDQEPKGKAYVPKGITGIGMRLLVNALQNWKKV